MLQLLANGHEGLEIAGRLGVSERELEAGLTNLLATWAPEAGARRWHSPHAVVC